MAGRDAVAKQPFLGHWRITIMELWTADDLDLLGPEERLEIGRAQLDIADERVVGVSVGAKHLPAFGHDSTGKQRGSVVVPPDGDWAELVDLVHKLS